MIYCIIFLTLCQVKNIMKNILLTGALGYIGDKIWSKLEDLGYNVMPIDNKFINKSLCIDFTDKEKMENIFKLNKIDAVIHCGALKDVVDSNIDPLPYYRTNVLGTLNLIELCFKYNCNKFIFSSSSSVYGNQPNKLPFKEDIELKPMSVYAKTKMMAEEILKDNSCDIFKVVILRYGNVIGDNRPSMDNIIGRLLKFDTFYIRGDGSSTRDYIDVNDVADANIKVLNNEKNFVVYNIGSGKETSINEIIEKFEKENNVKKTIKYVDKYIYEPDRCCLDISKFRRDYK